MRLLFMAILKFDKDASVIVVYVKLFGIEVVLEPKMALDTGATYVMISWDIAEKLGLMPNLLKERIETVTASGVEKVPLIELPLVSVAGKEAKNIKAIVHDLPQKSYVDGLLGLSFLRNFNVHLNFREGIFEID